MRAKIYAVINVKGGVGKSTTARGMSYYLTKQGKRTLLVDSDAQRDTIDWAGDREEEGLTPAIECVELTGKIHTALRELARNYDAIVVDCGGADSIASRSALVVADAVLVPCAAKKGDHKNLPKTADAIEAAQLHNTEMKVAGVVTLAPHLPSQIKRIDQTKEKFINLKLNPLKNCMIKRDKVDDCSEDGRTAQESGDQKAVDEMTSVFDEFFEAVG